jgi:hypothetical protein
MAASRLRMHDFSVSVREIGEMNAISITEPSAVRLVQELARREGKSELEVIVDAVVEKLGTSRPSGEKQDRKAYWLSVGQQNRLSIPADRRTLDVDQMLYDEAGLPQ